MRFVEFRVDEIPDDGNRGGQEPNRPVAQGLEAGPPYPSDEINAVKDMQTKLEALGYSVGSTGIDGKYGFRTARAVRAFKYDNRLRGGGFEMSADDLEKLASASPVANPTSTGDDGAVPQGSGNSRHVGDALDFFIEKGLTAAQAAGVVGNLQAESGRDLDPSAVGDGGQAHGIAQWHPDRRANFERAFGKSFAESSFEEQLEFIWWELNNTERNAFGRLRNTTTAEDAAYVFDRYYERSSGAHRQRRMQYAANLIASHPRLATT